MAFSARHWNFPDPRRLNGNKPDVPSRAGGWFHPIEHRELTPVIVLAGGAESVELPENRTPERLGTMALGWGISAISVYLVIHFFPESSNRASMASFAVYRIFPGNALLALLLG